MGFATRSATSCVSVKARGARGDGGTLRSLGATLNVKVLRALHTRNKC